MWVGTALHYAIKHNEANCARELIARGADVNAENVYGITPLIYASSYGYVKFVRLLLAAGADKRREGVDGETAHSEAYRARGDAAAIRALLDAAP